MTGVVDSFLAPRPSPRGWHPSSWRRRSSTRTSSATPHYFNDSRYDHVQSRLRKSAPIIFAKEAQHLQDELALASVGKAFVLIGGDCAETFEDSNVMKVWHDFTILVQMALLLTFGLEMPVVKIGRMCGQYAKPRSSPLETIGNTTLPSYQGDIINGRNFTMTDRVPNPMRMLEAYHRSVESINILRAFIQGGYTDIFNHESWAYFASVNAMSVPALYNDILRTLKKALRFMEALNISSTTQRQLRDVSFYIGHEALLLPYEECLVRNDSLTGRAFDCSAHYLWIGERTRALDGPHVEFCRGIQNPIGVKISDKITPDELLNLTLALNPENEAGRLSIITRMGEAQLRKHLPDLVGILQKHDRRVVWLCDPMHANTRQTVHDSGASFKTRYFNDIWLEVLTFCQIHWRLGSVPAGLHLEMTGQNVTECLGGYVDGVHNFERYESAMDPRLNPQQTIELVLLLCALFDDEKERRRSLS